MIKSYRPESFEEALNLIDNESCHIFAGGTDLMIRKRMWHGAERKFTQPIVFINHLRELHGIKEYEDRYEIMTLTTQAEVVNSNLPEYIKTPYSQMANPAIRNVATVGGNIVNAASVADSIPILIALDASIELVSILGKRVVLVSDFVLDKYKTIRHSNEILTKVIIKKQNFTNYYYKKLGQRKASILSKLSVFILVKDDDIRIAIGAVNNLVIRDRLIELHYLDNKNLDDLLDGLRLHMTSYDDKRSTKNYKELTSIKLIENYLKGGANEL